MISLAHTHKIFFKILKNSVHFQVLIWIPDIQCINIEIYSIKMDLTVLLNY